MSTGGMFLAGGISPKILPKLKSPAFMQAFLPATFFDYVGPFGARNDHYLGDVASFYAALR